MSKKKTKHDMKIKLFLAVGLLMGLLTGVIILLSTGSKPHTQVYGPGEQIQRKTYDIIINENRIEKITEPNSNTELNFVVVNLSIKNKSDAKLSFIPVFQSHIRTVDGITYSMSPLPGIQPIYAGDIEPGSTVTGDISYLVPDVDQHLSFFFDPGWNQEDAVYVKL